MDEMYAISPLDGRYYEKLQRLSDFFSEFALIKKRVYVELMYLVELGKAPADAMHIHSSFRADDAKRVKEIEKETNHDVKAVEYYLREKIPEAGESVHFGLTSEDINNLSYSLLIKEFLEQVYIKKIESILEKLDSLCLENRDIPMLARTHGQPASPTILGKEFRVFHSRLAAQLDSVKSIRLKGKLNGATGNYNALSFAEPGTDWILFSRRLIGTLGLEPNLVTTQIEPHDSWMELFHAVKRMNSILLDMDTDMWLYISMDYFRLRKKDNEVGSSTMPHKVNPIDFENSEGNIKMANAVFLGLEALQVSRMQRDLSDSTLSRNIGVAFAHTVLACDSSLKGLDKLLPNYERIKKDLEDHPEVLTEAVQTLLRKHNRGQAYEKLKEFSRGRKITVEDLHRFIDTLELDGEEKQRLKNLRPEDYTGLAGKLLL